MASSALHQRRASPPTIQSSLAMVCDGCLSRLRARAKEIGQGALIDRCDHYATVYGVQHINGRVEAGLLADAKVVYDRSTVKEPVSGADDLGDCEIPF